MKELTRYTKACLAYEKAKAERREASIALRLVCTHPAIQISEAPYQSSNFGDDFPAFRVCEVCGFAEEGFGYKYLVTDRPKKITRDEGYKIRIGIAMASRYPSGRQEYEDFIHLEPANRGL